VRLLAALALAVLPALAFPAPDEAALGKAEGYPVCPILLGQDRCIVGALSNYDKIYGARTVPHGPARALKRDDKAAMLDADAWMAANRNTGLLVMKGDTILAERYNYDRKESDRFQSFSMAKTVVAMLIGVALNENKIKSIDDKAEQYVPELKGQLYGATSLRHLLTMSSGVKFREDYDGKDDVSVLARKTIGRQGPGGADTVMTFNTRLRPAGEKFYYASSETQVLGLVLRAAVGQTLSQYLAEKIWLPMGAEADATWLIDAGGYETGYMGINATLRDWGRLGMLLANYGALDGKQLIPAAWVKAATTPESPHLRPGVATFRNGYGYQTWIIDIEGKFALLGVRGQGVFIDPVSKVVVVHTAAHGNPRDGTARGPQFELFFRTVKLAAGNG
jgi:CubicO group peptidase (beta-lactamase class C family)